MSTGTRFEVDQDRAERPGPQKAEIIHAKNARGRVRLLWCRVNHPQESIRRSEQAHPLHQTAPCLSAEGEGDQGEDFCEPKRFMSVRSDYFGQSLSKDFSLAVWIRAEKTPGVQLELNSITRPGQICQHPNVPRMHFV
jgi:hypothetical protein